MRFCCASNGEVQAMMAPIVRMYFSLLMGLQFLCFNDYLETDLPLNIPIDTTTETVH
jgi:hypothetical protein